MLCQNGHAAGADFVGRVPVGGDPVAAHKAGLDPAVFHDHGGHVVADQRYVHPGPVELIAGEPGPLEQGPGFVGKDADMEAPLRRQEKGPLGGAVAGGGQRPGVAVGEDAVPLL